jgi:hypothetical protein
MELCQYCSTAVLPMADGRCPSCLHPFAGVTVAELSKEQMEELELRKSVAKWEAYEAEKPLRRAVLLAQVAGWICVGLGTLGLVGVAMMAGALPENLEWQAVAMALGAAVVYIGPGIAYLVLAGQVKEYRDWAVTVLVVTGAVQVCLVVFGLIASVATKAGPDSAIPGARGVVAVGSGVAFGILALDAAVIVNLSRCHGIIRNRGWRLAGSEARLSGGLGGSSGGEAGRRP